MSISFLKKLEAAYGRKSNIVKLKKILDVITRICYIVGVGIMKESETVKNELR